jgi:hypothetical protein
MKFWEMIDRSRKRKALERMRQEYLVKVDAINENMKYIHRMNWSQSEQVHVLKSYVAERAGYQEKADRLEELIIKT